jgi:DNA-binding GntR family transcriptional regulator
VAKPAALDNLQPTLGSTAVETTLAAIRQLLADGTLTPGEHVRQGDLGAQLGVSRIPVREALQVMVAEGLIQYSAMRGFFVTKLTTHDFLQLRKMRGALEEQALAHLDWPGDEALNQLRELNDAYLAAGSAGDVAESNRLNRRFHLTVLDASRYQLIVREIRRLMILSDLYRSMFMWDRDAISRSHGEHLDMIDALAAKDTEALVRLRHQHSSRFDAAISAQLDRA